MNSSAFSAAIKEAFAIAPTNLVIFETLTITQPTVQGAVYLVRARQSLTATDEGGIARIYEPCGFNFSLPPASEEGFQSLNVSIDNVGRRVIEFLQNAKASEIPVEVTYRPYLSTDLSRPQMDPPLRLHLKVVSVDEWQVSARATFLDIVNTVFPSEIYSRRRFPSLG